MSMRMPAVGAEGRRRRLVVPLVAGHQVDHAQVAAGDPGPQRPQRGHIAPPVRDLERHAGRRGGGDRRAGLPGGHPARLLAQHRQAAGGDRGDELGVLVAGRRDQDPVHGRVIQQLPHVRVERRAGVRNRVAAALRHLGDRRHRHLPGPGQGPHVGAAHPARPDQAQPEGRRHVKAPVR